VLCGVELEHAHGLVGHSDADVAVHALIDALLGAAGMGDIGRLFPDTDPAFKDACSIDLLAAVASRLHDEGWRVENVDVTIVCELPRLAPYREDMRARLAAALAIEAGAVSVKATTTEGMGFEGRGEGISAQAVCLLTRPGA
jgi:2-C-methyl-D-erythritol 2,4-cyclodiphosphate synthase